MIVLGIWGWSSDEPDAPHHDSGAAIVADGRILAAVNEERITRRKCEGRWPEASIEAALRLAGVAEREVGLVALAGRAPVPRAALMTRMVLETARETGVLLSNRLLYAALTAKKIRRLGPPGFAAPTVCVGHHEAHAAAAFFTGPWDTATVVTLDGIGDQAVCGGVWCGARGRLEPLRSFNGHYSPGLLYSFVTRCFGFQPSRHEGKVTGLAAYGDPAACLGDFERLVEYDAARRRPFSRHVPLLLRAGSYDAWRIPLFDEMAERATREEIAAALQRRLEDLAARLVADAVAETGSGRVALAGGVFANVRVNQRIAEIPGVEGVWIHPNMGDGGLAAGAALAAERAAEESAGRAPRPPEPLPHVFLGPAYGEAECEAALRAAGVPFERPPDVEAAAAGALAAGRIVGRFAGGMEYGPRALGHRTILASAADRTINDWLNKRLKRTEFMPFAPSLLEEDAPLYLEGWRSDDAAARFMTITYRCTDRARRAAPAVVHVDGTARPHVVRRRDDPAYHRLIETYKGLTGEGILINTSFNVHEEPIVMSPGDAVRSLQRGAVDLLALGPFWARRA